MADQRGGGISWTEETWNPIRGCSKVSEGCRNCYAMNVAARFSGPGQPYEGLALRSPARWTGEVRLVEGKLDQPLRWKRPRLIFVNSMSDLFHESLTDEQIDQVVAVMALAYWHTFQVLTKRPRRMAEYLKTRRRATVSAVATRMATDREWDAPALAGGLGGWPLRNVWWGTSVEDQKTLDERMPSLLACRNHAAVLWLSMEPLLGPVRLNPWWRKCPDHRHVQPGPVRSVATCPDHRNSEGVVGIDWVVVGGESGAGARPMNPAWARAIRDECRAAGVPFHFKQWGEWTPGENVTRQRGQVETAMNVNGQWMFGQEQMASEGGHVDDEPDLYRVGKKAAGRLLDGVLHDAMPAMGAGGR